MVLRNWYNAFKSFRKKGIIKDGLTALNGTKSHAGYYNNGGTDNQSWLALYSTSMSYSTYTYGIMIGSGGTPATLDDYKLEALITSGLSVSVSVTSDDDNDGVYKLTITNTSGVDVTIKEIGMALKLYTGSNSTVSANFLVERTVLDNPITIPAGGIGLIDYAIKLPIPEV